MSRNVSHWELDILHRYLILEPIMRGISAAILAISFVSLAVFGFAAMHTERHENCFANSVSATMGGAQCEENGSPLAMIAFHLGTLRSFSTALASYAFTLVLFATALAVVLAFALETQVVRAREPFVPTAGTSHLLVTSDMPSEHAFRAWLSFCVNSPNAR